jgi:hypothetical protein
VNQDWPVQPFAHLLPDTTYEVVRAFEDFDGQEHPVGESWVFIGASFVPYDDGLSLFVAVNGKRQQIRLQWRDEEQGPIIDQLKDYVQAKK